MPSPGCRTAWRRFGSIRDTLPDLVLLDIRLPKLDGIAVVKQVKADPRTRFIPVIMVTALTELEERVRGLDAGADDYITKPFQSFELLARIRSTLRIRRMYEDLASTRDKLKRTREENRQLRMEIQGKYSFDQILGQSAAMRQVFHLMEKAVESPITVVILGETGTGKELVARSIHYNSPRKDQPFVVQNCGALPESLLESELFGHKKGAFTGAVADKKGLFEIAHGGTIFLDEVGDTPPALQVRLLRVLQEGEIRRLGEVKPLKVDVRVIAATHKDLKEEIKTGKFREDLFYRISCLSDPSATPFRAGRGYPGAGRPFPQKIQPTSGEKLPAQFRLPGSAGKLSLPGERSGVGKRSCAGPDPGVRGRGTPARTFF